MLSVAKLALGQEAYYEQQVALGLDDYYAGRGESPGLWVGSGAEAIELVGTVEEGALSVLLSGLSPADGERLRAPARERTITVRTLDEATGIWRDEPKTLAPVAGYDLVFSCPKSVSLLHALTGDEDVRRAISEAHEALLAGGPRLPRGRGLRGAPRPRRRDPRARARASSRPPSVTAPAAPRTHTCTPT